VSSLRLTDEDEDVMVVTLLLSAVLSRSTSVPLVEVLDKEALSLAIFPELVPIIRGKQSSWVQKGSFSSLAELSAKNEDGPMKFANSLQPQRAALRLLSIETKETAWGRKTSRRGVRVGSNFQFQEHCCDLEQTR